jgi:hypothetical protein
MKIRQNIRHWAAKQALTAPVLGGYVTDKLVALHTDVFADRAEAAHREERRGHLGGTRRRPRGRRASRLLTASQCTGHPVRHGGVGVSPGSA